MDCNIQEIGRKSFLFHVHSSASFDGVIRPKHIVKYCSKNKIDYLCVTDHDNCDALKRLKYWGSKYNVSIIPGIEYSSEGGDIIGLGVEFCIDSKDPSYIINHIHANGGLVVLPHPFKAHDLSQISLEEMDLVEIFNARCSPTQNWKAKELQIRYEKLPIVGSDAHLWWELPKALNFYEHNLSDSLINYLPIKFQTAYSFKVNQNISQIVKGVKLRKYDLIWHQIKDVAKRIKNRIINVVQND